MSVYLKVRPQFKAVGKQFGSFALVGLAGTAAHYAVLYLLVEWGQVGAVLASGWGALTGLIVNYFLNHGLTFNSVQPHWRTFPKFALVGSFGLGLNLLLMAGLVNGLQLYYLYAQVLVTGIVLVWNFFANRLWTFKAETAGPGADPASKFSVIWHDCVVPQLNLGPALLGLALLIRLIASCLYPLIDPTESRYAEMARKMLETGNWVTPQIGYGVPFWGKPPLAVWLNAINLSLFGINEFAARLSALLLCAATVGLVYRLALTRVEKPQAFAAPAILAGMALFFVMAGSVAMDQCLNFGVTLALVSFWLAFNTERRIYGYLFFIGLSIGLMAKGPIAVILVGIPVGLWVLIRNEWKAVRQGLPWVGGTVLMLAISVPWYLLAEHRTPGFLEYFFIGEHWKRFTEKGWQGDLYGSGRAHPLGMVWLYWLGAALPWSPIFLAMAGVAFWRKKARQLLESADGWRLYCLLWMLAPLLFFTFSANVIWTYALPGLPGCALLLAEWRRDGWMAWLSNDRAAFWIGILFPALFLAVVLAWQVVPFQFVRTQKSLVSQYLKLRQGSEDKLIYLWEYPYSAEFYTRGGIGEFDNVEQFQNAMDNPKQVFFACPRRSWADLPGAIKRRLQPIGAHNGFLLLYRFPKPEGQ
jgi:4-amino-4-deoxy-L-arabinose transferase-like glycosyltransferase